MRTTLVVSVLCSFSTCAIPDACGLLCERTVGDCADFVFCNDAGFCESFYRAFDRGFEVHRLPPTGRLTAVPCEVATAEINSLTRRRSWGSETRFRSYGSYGSRFAELFDELSDDDDDDDASEEGYFGDVSNSPSVDEDFSSDSENVADFEFDLSDLAPDQLRLDSIPLTSDPWEAFSEGPAIQQLLIAMVPMLRGGVIDAILEFPRISVQIDLNPLNSLLRQLPHSAHHPEIMQAAVWSVPTIAAWRNAVARLLAVIYNNPFISNEQLEAAQSLVHSHREFLLAIDPHAIHPVMDALLAGLSGLGREDDDSVLNGSVVNGSVGAPVSELLHSFVNADRSLADREICENIDPNIFASFRPSFLEVPVVGQFVRICSAYVSLAVGAALLPLARSLPNLEDSPATRILVHQEPFSVEEALQELRPLSKLSFSVPPEVRFVGSMAQGEGPRVEWLSSVIPYAMHPDFGIFEFSDKSEIFIKPRSIIAMEDPRRFLSDLHQVGRLIGLGIADSLTLKIALTPGCVALLRGGTGVGFDAAEFWRLEDSENLANVLKLRHDLDGAEGADFPNDTRTLAPSNVEEFIIESGKWKVFGSIEVQTKAILAGIEDVLPYGSLGFHSVDSLTNILRGALVVDVLDLDRSATYDPPTSVLERTEVGWLWEILSQYSQAELRMFVRFVSGSEFPPVFGFSGIDRSADWLQIKFDPTIPLNGLPQAQTCFHMLKLPVYSTKRNMKKRLDFAIRYSQTVDRV